VPRRGRPSTAAPPALVIALLASGCVAADPSPRPSPILAPGNAETSVELEVVAVIDGDSLIATDGSGDIEIRLGAINAPERDECLGPQARDALIGLVDRGLRATFGGLDQYGRTLAQVSTPDGEWINASLVASGLAVTVSGPGDAATDAERDALFDAQHTAMVEGTGLWGALACGATEPPPAVVLALDSPDPPGPDQDILDQEFVTITNAGTDPLDLSGWTLRDESTANRFVFPPGSEVAAGASVRVVSGCSQAVGAIAWCAPQPVWNNDGDSAFLLDGFGRIVATDTHRP
jgi:endonuclease YncB( thermonuclease family)